MSDSTDEKENKSLKQTASLMISIIVIGFGIILIVLFLYIYHFGSQGFSNDQAFWGQFGDFFGGTANPILSFFTILLLAVTIIIQSKQLSTSSEELKLSREELKLTRQELAKSADAQEGSKKALLDQVEMSRKSSRLETINSLLVFLNDRDRNASADEKIKISQQKKELHSLIEKAYEEIINLSQN